MVKLISLSINLGETNVTCNKVSLFNTFFTCITTQSKWNVYSANVYGIRYYVIMNFWEL